MEEQLAQGNMNPGISSKPVGDGITEHRGKNGGRILVRESENDVVEILGKCGKRPAN
jgi:putative component of toxin-antitoxin plasmid stabilization module